MNRDDFLILKSGIIYFDSGATSLKPYILSETTSDYYNNYSANSHRGDYDISLKVDTMYENTRLLVKNFINAKITNQIVFTNNSTATLTMNAFTKEDKANRRRGVKKVMDKVGDNAIDGWDLSGIINRQLEQEEIITL